VRLIWLSRWAPRVAMLSALTGGGLAAAGAAAPASAPLLGASALADASTVATQPSTGSAESGAPPAGEPAPTTTESTQTTTPTSTSTTPIAPSAPAVPAPAPSPSAPQDTPPPAQTTGAPTPAAGMPAVEVTPTVKAQRPQQTTAEGGALAKAGEGQAQPAEESAGASAPQRTGSEGKGDVERLPGNVAAGESGALASLLGNFAASARVLDYYRIPIFLLPIYQAAAVQYGVPWQILAAINEVETDYGSDLSISTAGAEGWMQFMPATWLQYGVDALDAGYADPYNPVDAIFATARYLHAAGAATNLRAAILAYNHSEVYVQSVILRAQLIASYPKPVISTLTGIATGIAPLSGAQVVKEAPTFVDLVAPGRGAVVAAQDGRIIALGDSRSLGRYVVLRDVYGNVYTYSGLGSVATRFRVPRATAANAPEIATLRAEAAKDPRPTTVASAGIQPAELPGAGLSPGGNAGSAATSSSTLTSTSASASTLSDTVTGAAPGAVSLLTRLPGELGVPATNPAPVARRARAGGTAAARAGATKPLRVGSFVSRDIVLGRLASAAPGARDSVLRFAIRPAGDASAIDPRPILENWGQLRTALDPQGAKGGEELIADTVSSVLLLAKSELARTASAGAKAVSSAATGKVAPSPLDVRQQTALADGIGPSRWSQLIARIGALPAPKVAGRRSASAIRDSRHSPGK
jgi:membrane-bound lytic murein transglycosylase B